MWLYFWPARRFLRDDGLTSADECWATKAKYLPRVEFHSRGRAGRKHKYFSHVFVKVSEGRLEEGSRRLGKVGRTLLKTRMNELWEEQMETRYEEIRTQLENVARTSQEAKLGGSSTPVQE